MPISKATASSVAPAAKGDLVVGSATNDAAVLAVGTNDHVLTADSSTATGLKWAAASAGSITSITSGNLTSTAVNLTNITQTYKHLYLILRDYYPLADGETISVRINNVSTGAKYSWGAVGSVTTFGGDQQNQIAINNQNFVVQENDDNNIAILYFWDYTNATVSKYFDLRLGYEQNGASTAPAAVWGGGYHFPTTPVAITQLNILCSGTGFGGGSYELYGVN